jgi:hypothetical protein
MGEKGIWRHVEGRAVTPKEYAVVNGVPVISDGKTPATEEQIEMRETQIIDYDKRECLAQHVILLTTSTCLGAKIKDLKMAKEMWDIVKADATTKSMLYLLDVEDQLTSMKLSDNNNPKTHLAELKEHFQLMNFNLIKSQAALLVLERASVLLIIPSVSFEVIVSDHLVHTLLATAILFLVYLAFSKLPLSILQKVFART